MFPEGAGYEHDKMDRRTELSEDQKPIEPQNADSHLAFMAGALRTCVTYQNKLARRCRSSISMACTRTPRRRVTSVLGYTLEEAVAQTAADRSRLRPRRGLGQPEEPEVRDLRAVHRAREALRRHHQGPAAHHPAPGERHAGLTVNEYETLLMRHDLSEVLRDPLRFMAEKAGHMLGNPRAIPAKTLDYASAISSACSTGCSTRWACASRWSKPCCRRRSPCRRRVSSG